MPSALTEPLPANVIAAARRGQKIEAVALLRDRTGIGLRDATDAVDAWCDGHSPHVEAIGQRSGGPKASAALWILVVALCVALGAYFFLPTLR